jgi:GDPmannose 4,6-dehydratase
MNLIWGGRGQLECASSGGKVVVGVDPRYLRPAEVDTLCGDATKAKEKLGWVPEYTFDQLVDEMVEAELAR